MLEFVAAVHVATRIFKGELDLDVVATDHHHLIGVVLSPNTSQPPNRTWGFPSSSVTLSKALNQEFFISISVVSFVLSSASKFLSAAYPCYNGFRFAIYFGVVDGI